MTKESLLQVLESLEITRRRIKTNQRGRYLESEEQERLDDLKTLDHEISEVKQKIKDWE